MLFNASLALALQSADADAVQAPASPPNCQTDAHAGFDFWLGEWEVYPNGQEKKVGESSIIRVHNGCAVIENWTPQNGQTGTSLNHYDPASGQWNQKWVGSSPGAVEFVGGVVEGKMVLTGNWPSPSAPHALVRMTYTANDDGSVRQHGEASTDHGLSWQTAFDFIYRPKDPDET